MSQEEQTIKQCPSCSLCFSFWFQIPALNSAPDFPSVMDCRLYDRINPFLPKLISVMVFITAIENRLWKIAISKSLSPCLCPLHRAKLTDHVWWSHLKISTTQVLRSQARSVTHQIVFLVPLTDFKGKLNRGRQGNENRVRQVGDNKFGRSFMFQFNTGICNLFPGHLIYHSVSLQKQDFQYSYTIEC